MLFEGLRSPISFKIPAFNGISSWRQQFNVQDKQVGMDEGGVSGAGHGWISLAMVAVLQPHMQKVG